MLSFLDITLPMTFIKYVYRKTNDFDKPYRANNSISFINKKGNLLLPKSTMFLFVYLKELIIVLRVCQLGIV